jgi:dolichyl-phosphate beta-glucosyltransferase
MGLAAITPPPQLSVVVPAYNERARIQATLSRIVAYLDETRPGDYEVIVVDDGSDDGTADLVADLAPNNARLRVLRYTPNRGKGHAVRYGMLRAQGRFLLFCDADLATPIEEVETLFARLDQAHAIAIGSRDTPGANLTRRQSPVREMGGKLFNRCVQALAVPGIRDTQCGFKLFTREAACDVLSHCRVDNFSFDVEILYLARQRGHGIAEVPVRWAHQEGSKVRFLRDGWRMLKTLWRIRTTDYRLDARAPAAPPRAVPDPEER